MRKICTCSLAILLLASIVLPLTAAKKERFAPPREVWVSNEQEFLEAIAPNTTIRFESMLRPYLSFTDEFSGMTSDYVNFEEVYDGVQLVIQGVPNLSIVGDPDTSSQVLTIPRYAYVLMFKNCKNLSLANLDCGHYDEGYCTGGVLGFENCDGIEISNCDLWGCGTEGISLWNSSGLNCSNTTIRDCSYSILSLYDSRDIQFSYCVMRNNREFTLLNFVNCQKVGFSNCVIYDNSSAEGYGNSYLIYTNGSGISFNECAIFNNNVSELMNTSKGISFRNCTIFGNRIWAYVPGYDEGRAEDGYWEQNEEW